MGTMRRVRDITRWEANEIIQDNQVINIDVSDSGLYLAFGMGKGIDIEITSVRNTYGYDVLEYSFQENY